MIWNICLFEHEKNVKCYMGCVQVKIWRTLNYKLWDIFENIILVLIPLKISLMDWVGAFHYTIVSTLFVYIRSVHLNILCNAKFVHIYYVSRIIPTYIGKRNISRMSCFNPMKSHDAHGFVYIIDTYNWYVRIRTLWYFSVLDLSISILFYYYYFHSFFFQISAPSFPFISLALSFFIVYLVVYLFSSIHAKS